MKALLLKYWERFQSSFWFLPSLMTGGAVVLAFTTVALDRAKTDELLQTLGWAYTGGAEGASAVLETIAGSMITIAGVVFSITLVALSIASSQLGPRVLRNFMRDHTNQLVIGTFVATFVYCLLVLRTIRYPGEGAFVPHLSVTLGVMLAIAAVGVLIYFIHHISRSIQADVMVTRVGRELIGRVDALFPERLGRGAREIPIEPPDAGFPDAFDQEARPIPAGEDGYVQSIEPGALMALATEEDILFRVERGPGHYVVADQPLVFVWPGDRITDSLTAQVNAVFLVGSQRTPHQDVEFAVNQLVEIAVRALSPSLNDPFTAIRCVDRLGSALCRVARQNMPSPYRYDEQDELRVVAPVVSFPEIADAAFNKIRQCAGSSTAVTIRLLDAITVIAEAVHRPEDRAALRRHAEMIVRGAREGVPEEEDLRAVEDRYQVASQALRKP